MSVLAAQRPPSTDRRRTAPASTSPLLGALLLIAFALRTFGLDRRSLWIDEGYVAYVVRGSLLDAIRGAALDVHPPLYFVLVNLWRAVAGDSEFALRFPSVLFSILTIALVARIGGRLADRWVGAVAALALTVAGFSLWQAQEARMYSLLGLETAAAFYLQYRQALEPRRGHLVALTATLVAAVYTHYHGLFVVAVVAMLGLLLRRMTGRPRLAVMWLPHLLALAAFVPWAPVFLGQMREHYVNWAGPFTLDDGVYAVTELVAGLRTEGSLAEPAVLLSVGLVVGVVAFGCLQSERGRAPFVVWTTWLLAPTGLILLARMLGSASANFDTKHLLLVMPALALLLASGLARLGRRSLGAAAVVVLVLGSIPGLWRNAVEYDKQDWRGMVGYIVSQRRPGDIVLQNPTGGIATLRYYLARFGAADMPVDGCPEPYRDEKGPWVYGTLGEAELRAWKRQVSASHGRVWIVQFSRRLCDPTEAISKVLPPNVAIPSFAHLEVSLHAFEDAGR